MMSMYGLILPGLLYVNRLEIKFFTGENSNLTAPAFRAVELMIIRCEYLLAVTALHLYGDAPKVQPGALCDGIFGDNIPVELD